MPEPTASPPHDLAAFFERWEPSGGSERGNCQSFLTELCDVLGVPRPEPARTDDADNAYVFERAVTFRNPDGSTAPGWADLYRRGCFVLEAKQGSDRLAPESIRRAVQRVHRGTAVRAALGEHPAGLTADGLKRLFSRAPSERVGELLQTLVAMGQARALEDGRYVRA